MSKAKANRNKFEIESIKTYLQSKCTIITFNFLVQNLQTFTFFLVVTLYAMIPDSSHLTLHTLTLPTSLHCLPYQTHTHSSLPPRHRPRPRSIRFTDRNMLRNTSQRALPRKIPIPPIFQRSLPADVTDDDTSLSNGPVYNTTQHRC